MSPLATRLSGIHAGLLRPRARRRSARLVIARVACSSLVASIAMTSSSCLITSTPQFDEPEQTRPFLVGSSAFPSLSTIVKLDKQSTSIVEFSADVMSQDAPDANVECRLFIDYGYLNSGYPFRFTITGNEVPAGSLNQAAPRRCKASWPVSLFPVETGCHNVTLLATHATNPQTFCPEKEDDYSILTWQVFFCDSSQGSTACDNLDITPCASWSASCFSSSLDAGGGS